MNKWKSILAAAGIVAVFAVGVACSGNGEAASTPASQPATSQAPVISPPSEPAVGAPAVIAPAPVIGAPVAVDGIGVSRRRQRRKSGRRHCHQGYGTRTPRHPRFSRWSDDDPA